MDAAGSESSLELIVAADVARTRFWAEYEAAVVSACAPLLVDKQEVLAYLLNDALYRPLLHADFARDVGRRCDNGAAKAKGLLKVKAKRDVAEACWKALQAKPKALALQPPYDLNLEAPSRHRRCQAHSGAVGCARREGCRGEGSEGSRAAFDCLC